MDYQILPVTAEIVIGAIEAVLLNNDACDESKAANFLEVPPETARHGLDMALQLGFISRHGDGKFRVVFPQASYLGTSRGDQKAAILRFLLESYQPYRFFKQRLDITQNAEKAAQETKAKFDLAAHKSEIKDTLISLGQYAQSIELRGGGSFVVLPLDDAKAPFVYIIKEVMSLGAQAANFVRRRLGAQAIGFINQAEVFDPLVSATSKLSDVTDTRSPILFAGNAVESFLCQIAAIYKINVANDTGIFSKGKKLKTNNIITGKQLGILGYLGNLRNAADHGTDPEIQCTWDIAAETTFEYVLVAISSIRSIVAKVSGQFIL